MALYLSDNKLLNKYQSSFRSLHSTSTALLDATNQWYFNIDNGLATSVVFLDLAKAFDTFDHNINYSNNFSPIIWESFHRPVSDQAPDESEKIKLGRAKRAWRVRFFPLQTTLGYLCPPAFSFPYNTISLRAGSRWSASARRSRETRKWACSDLCKFFISTPETAEEISQLIFTGSMNFGSSDFSGFHNNMQAQYTLLNFVNKVLPKKNRQCLCLARTHTWFQVILLWRSGLWWCW